MGLTRRGFLLGTAGAVVAGGGAVALVEQRVLPGELRLHRLLGACDVGRPLPDAVRGPVETTTLTSAARGREVRVAIVHPPDVPALEARGVCVYLHGRGGDHEDATDARIGLPWLLADCVARGTPPFTIVGVEGGNGYWHARADGDDAGRMVVEELLPLLAKRGLAVDRIALLGTSMGGFGALLHAERLGPERVAAVGALSPALWRRFDDAAPGAFDTAEDFADHDVIAGRERLAGIPTRLDCGRDDAFADACRSLLDGAPDGVEGAISAGCHDAGFWRAAAPRHLDRIGLALAASA